MFPKIGNVVKLNPNFLKVWFRRGNKYFGEEVWEDEFTVTEIDKFQDGKYLRINFENKDFKYKLGISSSGELSTSVLFKEYEGIQVFISVNNKNDMYCSCGGPKEENCVLGKKFYVCTNCKKEII